MLINFNKKDTFFESLDNNDLLENNAAFNNDLIRLDNTVKYIVKNLKNNEITAETVRNAEGSYTMSVLQSNNLISKGSDIRYVNITFKKMSFKNFLSKFCEIWLNNFFIEDYINEIFSRVYTKESIKFDYSDEDYKDMFKIFEQHYKGIKDDITRKVNRLVNTSIDKVKDSVNKETTDVPEQNKETADVQKQNKIDPNDVVNFNEEEINITKEEEELYDKFFSKTKKNSTSDIKPKVNYSGISDFFGI